MRFLVDAQLPPALARLLVAEGFAAEHVYDIGFDQAEDGAIWDYANDTKATIITKDEDFIILASVRLDGPPIVWVRLGNTTKQALLAWFKPLLPAIIKALESGEKLVELSHF
jgi:predicted nuclease of predicted toxin-antitoxin system